MTNEKEICDRCGKAQWAYMPGTAYYCNTCVPRGCSCNLIDELDEYSRPYPCCEYLFDVTGFDKT